jgi:hypothetical protein
LLWLLWQRKEQRGRLALFKAVGANRLVKLSFAHLNNHLNYLEQEALKFIGAMKSGLEALMRAEPEITQLDTIAGDGDCGLTLKAGAEGLFVIHSLVSLIMCTF